MQFFTFSLHFLSFPLFFSIFLHVFPLCSIASYMFPFKSDQKPFTHFSSYFSLASFFPLQTRVFFFILGQDLRNLSAFYIKKHEIAKNMKKQTKSNGKNRGKNWATTGKIRDFRLLFIIDNFYI